MSESNNDAARSDEFYEAAPTPYIRAQRDTLVSLHPVIYTRANVAGTFLFGWSRLTQYTDQNLTTCYRASLHISVQLERRRKMLVHPKPTRCSASSISILYQGKIRRAATHHYLSRNDLGRHSMTSMLCRRYGGEIDKGN